MQPHIDKIARHVLNRANAVPLLDRACWHKTGALTWPKNITPILLPSRSPELNPVEPIWQYRRVTFRQPRVRELRRDHRGVVRGLEQARRAASYIPSIGMRDWPHIGQS